MGDEQVDPTEAEALAARVRALYEKLGAKYGELQARGATNSPALEWWGMPEFVQKDLTARYRLIVNFKSFREVQRFAALVGQQLTAHTRSIWFPPAEIGHMVTKRYADEP